MSRIIIQQENERQLDTIRARVIEQSIWKQGQRKVRRSWTIGSKECRNRQKCVEACGDVRRVGNRVAEVGLEYFCPDYVSKNGMSVMECNSLCCSASGHWETDCPKGQAAAKACASKTTPTMQESTSTPKHCCLEAKKD